jgi:ubiquinone/menaquinone biosynthesis C-methylase UbiE
MTVASNFDAIILLLKMEKSMIADAQSQSAPFKGHKGLGMEGFIAKWYARQTAKDIEEFKKTAQRLASHIKPGSCVLEIAPGPGYLAIEVAKLARCRMVGADISRTFIGIANANAEKAGLDIAFEEADAADLPYPANGFDFIFCRAAFKNFSRPLAALNEMYRVLKPGCDAVIMDLRKDFSAQDLNSYLNGKGAVNAALIKLIFNTLLKKRAYTQQGIAQLAAQSQFRQADLRMDTIGFELWLHKPQ